MSDGKQQPRVAIGEVFTECNHFVAKTLGDADFARSRCWRGDAVLGISTGTVGAMLAELRGAGATVLPLPVASSLCGGPIQEATYQRLKADLLADLAAAMPVDGVLMSMHGSATAVETGDVEGDVLAAIRELVGPAVPVVATLDLHGHVTEKMVRAAEALVAYETYPHRDTATTGTRGACLLLDTLAGRVRPTMAMAKIPLRVSGINGGTEDDSPFAEVMRLAKSLERQDGVLCTNVFLVHPYLDLPEMGCAAVVITDDDPGAARTVARRIADAYWARREDFDPPTLSPAAAIQQGLATTRRPVLLVEAADCCGGGAAGDSVHTLRALVAGAPADAISLVPVVDPAAATACHRAGLGAAVTVAVGHHIDPQWGEPLAVTGHVQELSDGWFTYAGGFWDGQRTCMGPSAVLAIGPVRLLITSAPTYEWGDEQFRAVGLDPATATFIVAKNPMNYHRAYPAIAAQALLLDTPGPTPAVPRNLPHRHPLTPLPEEPEMSQPTNAREWLSYARRHMRDGTFDAAVLEELEAALALPVRQQLLYLHASTPHVYSAVLAYDRIDPFDDSPADIDVEPVFPYESVYQAMRDGWQIIHFPDQRAPFDDREIAVLGYEFILQKIEAAHV